MSEAEQRTMQYTLRDEVCFALDPLNSFIGIMSMELNGHDERLGQIARVLLERAYRRYDVLFEFLNNNLGKITLDTISRPTRHYWAEEDFYTKAEIKPCP